MRPGLVPRKRLVNRLLDSRGSPVAALIAPAGYGKSTVLAEWAAVDERPFAWIGIEKADNDPARLLGIIASALARLEPGGPELFGPAGTPPSRFSAAAVRRLGLYLENRRADFVLVLDDVHRLDGSEALAVLTAVADHLSNGSQLALGARSDPALPLGRMRTQRTMTEMRSRDLAMTRDEAGQMLAAAGLRLDPRQLATLVDRTEGWPAGLYLAALSLQEQADVGRAVARFAGDDRLVTDYLRDELLSRLSAQRLRFLMRTSVLDRLSGPLCDAVLDRSGSAGVLKDMSRSNLLLIPLDRGDEWYRYHTLLLEGLRAELHLREPERERELHRRASDWHTEHHDLERAIEHALAAEDAARAGELLWAAVPRYLPGGQVMTVKRWLSRLSDQAIAAHAPLALAAAACALNTGDGDLVERWTSAAANALEREPPAEPAAVEAGIAMMRAAIAHEGIERMRDDAARANDLLDDDSPWRAMGCMLEGVARHLSGDRDGGRERLEEGGRRAAVANVPDIHALCLAQLALLGAGRPEGASDGSEGIQASAQAERAGLADFPDMALAFAASADLHAQRGQVEAGARDLQHAQLLLAMLGDGFASWYHVEARALLARASLRLSDVPRARKLVAEARRFLHGAPDAPVLTELLDEVCRQADAFRGSPVLGSSSLTTAELRVLQLLPTHLSFAEIAERLYVSTNTVKTQAHATYRKLDASSRSEAVDRARALGLLDDPQGG